MFYLILVKSSKQQRATQEKLDPSALADLSQPGSFSFWNAYLRGQAEFLPYLTARYGALISEDQPMKVDIISQLTPHQLETAYGRTTPIPVIPTAIAPLPPPRDQNILADIDQTGILTIGIRKDAAPFGFINQEQAWDGYCGELALTLADYLTQKLNRSVPIQVVELPSTLETRYDLVQNSTVHLECGPNTIRQDLTGITFSNPFFFASAQFLLRAERQDEVNPNLPLAGLRLGVLSDSTTEQFVQATYPDANIVAFSGPEGSQAAIQGVADGAIDAFVNDGILTYANLLLNQDSLDEFALLPDLPLTCEFYGLALPNNDPEWQTAVNQYLISDRENTLFTEWFTGLYPQTLSQANYCLNQ